MPVPRKVDLVRQHWTEYVAPRNPRIITVGKAQYLSLSGQGSPEGELFQKQVCALRELAYTLKRTKKKLGKDFKVCPLEGLWRQDGRGWKLLIRVPTFVQRRDLPAAVAALLERGRECSEEARTARLEQLKEGRCVQALHVGPWPTAIQTLERMRRAAQEARLHFHGQHHKIFLSDPRRVAPERLRTILRQPVRAAR